jgi:thymidine phosphorylase
MFKAKKLEVETNHKYISMLLENDAKKLGLKIGDRINIFCGHPTQNSCVMITSDLNIINSKSIKNKDNEIRLKHGEIGIFEEAFHKLKIKEGSRVNVSPAQKPKSIEYVKNKFKGKRIKENEMLEIIQDISNNKYTNVETTYFVLGGTAHPFNDSETIALSKAMVTVGKELNFKTKKNKIIVDKHCIGGIPGNRTTMIVIPIVAAAGLTIPKTSSRSITSPSGTADTMEVLANVNLDLSEMYKIVKTVGGCIAWGGSLDLSPADDIIINVEHPLEIDSEGQMIASILSKKKSAGSTHILLDIPVGKYAKVKNKLEGIRLKKRFEKVAKSLGMNLKAIISDGSEPIGKGIGPLLEAKDVLKVLRNEKDQPMRLRRKAIEMSGILLELGEVCKKGEGNKIAEEILDFGLAYEKFDQILKAQGKKKIPSLGKYVYDVKSDKQFVLKELNNKRISKLAFMLGAPGDAAAGIYIHKRVGDKIEKNDTIITLYSNSELKLKYAKAYLELNSVFTVK